MGVTADFGGQLFIELCQCRLLLSMEKYLLEALAEQWSFSQFHVQKG